MFSRILAKFDEFLRNQLNPDWEIEEKEDEIREELRQFDNHRRAAMEMIERKRLQKEGQIREVVARLSKSRTAWRRHLLSLTNEVYQLIDWADEHARSKKRYRQILTCPFCGKTVLFKSGEASNRTVRCPYQACNRRIPITFT